MENKENKIETLSKIAGLLSIAGYSFKGIVYECISSSSHVLSHQFRGVEIKYDRGEFERLSKGENLKLSIYAYLNGMCFKLIY